MELVKHKVRRLVFANTKAYGAIAALKRNPFRVRKDTDLLIEGFPRSANSFVEALIRVTQPADWTLAHHTHAPASIIEASHRRIPALVLIRDPQDAVASWCEMIPGRIDPIDLLNEYVAFYRAIEGYRSSYILINFTGIPDGLSCIPSIAKERFDFDMAPIPVSKELVAEAQAMGDKLGEDRNGVKERYSPSVSLEEMESRRQRLQANRAALENGSVGETLAIAKDIYRKLAATADVK